MTVSKEIQKYKFDLVGVQEVNGTEVAPNQQANIHFSMERRMRIMNWVQGFSYIRVSYQQFRA
jgi:endonuclease/exonuclease/phosphatase family metal-dependent hydrolase